MTTQSISSVETLANTAIHTAECYNAAGKTLAGAYRTGVQRVLSRASERYSGYMAQSKLPGLNDDMRAKLVEGQQKFHDFLIQRADANTERLNSAMDRVAAANTNGITAVAERLGRIEQPVVQAFVKGITDLQLPMAKLSANVADKVVAGAKRIEERVNGTAADVVEAAEAAKARPARAARTTRKAR